MLHSAGLASLAAHTRNVWPHALRYGITGVIGTVAAVFTTISLIPQLARIWQLKAARDVSFGMFLLYSMGVLLWFLYGVRIHSLPIEASNGIALVFSVTILLLKLHFDRHES